MSQAPMLIGTIRDPDKIRVRLDVGDLSMCRIQGEMSARCLFEQIERSPYTSAPLLGTSAMKQAALDERVAVIRKHLCELLGGIAHEMAKQIESALASHVHGYGWERP